MSESPSLCAFPENAVRRGLFLVANLIDNGEDPATALCLARDSLGLTNDQMMAVQHLLPDEVTG